METLKNLNKLWRSSTLLPANTSSYSDAAAAAAATTERVYAKEVLFGEYEEDHVKDEEEEEEEESFFELELVMLNNTKTTTTATTTRDRENNGGRRVVPVEPDLKPHPHPHSTISILKSAPKFRVSLFRKHKDDHNDPDLKLKPKPKSRLEDEESNCKKATISTLIRENSSSNSPVSKPHKQSIMSTKKTEDEDDESIPPDSSKRFSKEVMHKYLKLKLIKPFHLKVAKRCGSVIAATNKSRLFELRDECSASPAPSLKPRSSSGGLRVVCRQLGKSRSASSMSSCSSNSSIVIGSRRDGSLVAVEQDDGGIQSAILHCKRSFNSSRDDSSMHSRSSSDSREQEQPVINIQFR